MEPNEVQSTIIKQEQEAQVQPKKAYTPPTLIVYGKLTELTEGGSTKKNEGSGQGNAQHLP